jgi:hypothetical protein
MDNMLAASASDYRTPLGFGSRDRSARSAIARRMLAHLLMWDDRLKLVEIFRPRLIEQQLSALCRR